VNLALSHAFSIGLMCIPPNLHRLRALSTPRSRSRPHLHRTRSRPFLFRSPARKARGLPVALASMPLHAQACLLCYRTMYSQGGYTDIRCNRASRRGMVSGKKEIGEKHSHPSNSGESSSGSGSWRRNHGLSQAGLSMRKHAVPGSLQWEVWYVHLTSPGQALTGRQPSFSTPIQCWILSRDQSYPKVF
jgi:hypothetical protein